MNKLGFLSFLMVIFSIFTSLIIRETNVNIIIGIISLSIFSLLGMIFAILSKKWLSGLFGLLLNVGFLVFGFSLLLTNVIAS